jgi:hypothetical protein
VVYVGGQCLGGLGGLGGLGDQGLGGVSDQGLDGLGGLGVGGQGLGGQGLVGQGLGGQGQLPKNPIYVVSYYKFPNTDPERYNGQKNVYRFKCARVSLFASLCTLPLQMLSLALIFFDWQFDC